MTSPEKNTIWDGLPKKFVSSLRIIFDVLDENGNGIIKLSDIEDRWQEGTVAGLPSGVLEALKKVSPKNGNLSFERFVAGLKIALLRDKNETNQTNSWGTDEPRALSSQDRVEPKYFNQNLTSSSHNHNDSNKMSPKLFSTGLRSYGPTTVAVKPNNAITKSRSLTDFGDELQLPRNPIVGCNGIENSTYTSYLSWQTEKNANEAQTNQRFLQNHSKFGQHKEDKCIRHVGETGRGSRAVGDGSSVSSAAALLDYGTNSNNTNMARSQCDVDVMQNSSKLTKKKEIRRHTLANGIDFHMIKRMKQLEQEKDILHQGLEAIEKAKEWYQKEIANVKEKQKYVGRGVSHQDSVTDANQERIDFEMARIVEINQHLKALVESSEKGFPMHMNLAIPKQAKSPAKCNHLDLDNTITMLKTQNRMLTQEVSQKSEKITQLERDKATLIRDMFEARSKNRKVNYEDTTFM